MKDIVADTKLVAYCGLYCGACKKYLNGKCPGCADNEKASWCKIRSCCMENNYSTCADCATVEEVADCNKFNNAMSKVFEFIFRSNRQACIGLIKEKGKQEFAEQMTQNKVMTIRR